MATPVTVVLTDGRKLLLNIANPLVADLVAFESHFNVSAELIGDRVTYSLFVAWRMARRADPTIMETDFDAFVELVEDLIGEEDAPATDPTEEEALTG